MQPQKDCPLDIWNFVTLTKAKIPCSAQNYRLLSLQNISFDRCLTNFDQDLHEHFRRQVFVQCYGKIFESNVI